MGSGEGIFGLMIGTTTLSFSFTISISTSLSLTDTHLVQPFPLSLLPPSFLLPFFFYLHFFFLSTSLLSFSPPLFISLSPLPLYPSTLPHLSPFPPSPSLSLYTLDERAENVLRHRALRKRSTSERRESAWWTGSSSVPESWRPGEGRRGGGNSG